MTPTTPLEYALAYAALGWPVLPLVSIRGGMCSCGDPTCKSPGKHPRTQHGLHEASADPAQLRTWWGAWPDANVGIRTGRASGLFAVDIDVKEGVDGEETWRALTAAHGAAPDTVEAITGSGGRHLVFALPADDQTYASTKESLGPGVDTRGENGYIVAEPSLHISGRDYVWEASSSPLDDTAPAPLPAWIAETLRRKQAAPALASADSALSTERVNELRSALAFIDADPRDTWLRVGMALHAEQPGQQGYGIWTEWSQESDRFDAKDQRYTWSHFHGPAEREAAVTANTIFAMAMANGWTPPAPPIDPAVRNFAQSLTTHVPLRVLGAPEPAPEIPAELLHPPGILADIVRYGLESSIRPVPIFAVQAALALGSVVCARRYMTTQRNYASLYFLNVAKSGTGKEEAKTTIEAILTAAGQRRLVGGSTYSSGNAVYSALLRKPQHLAIVDEFGKYMEAATAARDNFRADALTMLMESFGRAHADMSTPQFSTMTLSPTQAQNMEPRLIARPAITLLALTTPSSFYNALSSTRVLDGFLNRFLIAEHTGARMPMQEWTDVPVPEKVISWVQSILAPRGDMDVLTLADNAPDPLIVPFTDAATARSRMFEREMLAMADELDRDGLGDMAIRSREIGMRMALIGALADTPDTPVITDDVLDWCFSYVRFFLTQTVRALRSRMADSTTERQRNTIYAAILATGEMGVSNKELNRKPFLSIPKRDRYEHVQSLIEAEQVAWREIHSGARGRPRKALVAIAEVEEHSAEEAALAAS